MADPKNFGRYQVKQLLGRGAMGVVYLAEDPVITRKVAIKVISAQPGQADPELQARFEREFRSAGTLSHPNIVTIHDVGKQGTRTFIAMEYVEGKSLEDIANLERCMPLETVASLLDQICSGLDYAHERSIVHRDIKPANIIVTPDGRAKITDFGVAKVLDLATTGVTQEGATIGTPSYMSPEQAKGYRVKGSADQFSVAVMVYRLLTGERPFMGDSRSTVMYKIVHEDPITLNVLNRTIPAGVSAAVMKALGKDPTQRFPTCSAFAAAVRVGLAGGTVELPAGPGADLETVLLDPHAASGADTVVVETAATAGPPIIPAAGRRGSRRWRTALAAAVVLVAALGGWTWLAPPEPAGGAWWALRERAGRTWVVLSGTTTPGPTPVPVVPGPEFQGQVRVESNPPGANIWLDGADLGLVAPALVALEGDVGQEVQLQLRRDGTVAAAINLALGPEVPAEWTPEGVRTPEQFVITSAPPGARVVLDGDPVPGVTPVEVELVPGDDYNLRVELGGYRPASLRFTLADLTETQREDGVLPFPLTPRPPPGRIVINAPYAVEVTVRGRSGGPRRSGSSRTHNIELQQSTYDVELAAPDVFLAPQQRAVEVQAGASLNLSSSLPRAVTITVGAVPGNCLVSIDGHERQETPITTSIVVGRHQFQFEWPGLGSSRTRSEMIQTDGQRVFESSP